VSVGRLLGETAELNEDFSAARSFYEIALGAVQAIRFRPEEATIRLRLGELLLRRFANEREQAFAHLDLAIAEFEAKEPAYPDGLSEREVEVLRLIAGGKSNREIAEGL